MDLNHSVHGQEQIGFNCPIFDMVYPIGVINVWGTLDTVVCGETPVVPQHEDACESSDGYWYTKVSAVQRRFAEHNGCDISMEPEHIETASDGIRGWRCSGIRAGCTDGAFVMECRWDGRHTYPVERLSQRNFGLEVAVEYFYQFQHPKYKGQLDPPGQ